MEYRGLSISVSSRRTSMESINSNSTLGLTRWICNKPESNSSRAYWTFRWTKPGTIMEQNINMGLFQVSKCLKTVSMVVEIRQWWISLWWRQLAKFLKVKQPYLWQLEGNTQMSNTTHSPKCFKMHNNNLTIILSSSNMHLLLQKHQSQLIKEVVAPLQWFHNLKPLTFQALRET